MLTRALFRAPGARRARRPRRGMSLIELMVVLVILGLIGTALTRLLVQQSRNFSTQQAKRKARVVSRNAIGILLGELRMAQDENAVDSVASNGRAVRVELPYAFGLSCGNTGGVTIVRLAPVDSMVRASATASGYRYRDATDGRWKTTAGTFSAVAATGAQAANCTLNKIVKLKVGTDTGRVMAILPAMAAGAGTPVFLSQKVRYRFAPSTAYAQGYGLYRRVGTVEEELLGPFDTTSRFRYYVPNSDVATGTAPASLGTIRGLEVVLDGISDQDARSGSTGQVGRIASRVTTGVLFKNTRTF